MGFVNICSLSMFCLFFILSIACHGVEFLNFNEIQLINFFPLMDHVFEFAFKNLLSKLRLPRYFLMLSSSRSRFIYLFIFACVCQLFQRHLLKRLFFLHQIAFTLLSKICQLYFCRAISELSILFY